MSQEYRWFIGCSSSGSWGKTTPTTRVIKTKKGTMVIPILAEAMIELIITSNPTTVQSLICVARPAGSRQTAGQVRTTVLILACRWRARQDSNLQPPDPKRKKYLKIFRK